MPKKRPAAAAATKPASVIEPPAVDSDAFLAAVGALIRETKSQQRLVGGSVRQSGQRSPADLVPFRKRPIDRPGQIAAHRRSAGGEGDQADSGRCLIH